MDAPVLLGICGSPSTTSIHRVLLEHAGSLARRGRFELVSILDVDAPIYTPQREADGVPPDILALHARIAAADGLLIASPEHNGYMPAMLKNVIDWLSRVERGTPFLPKPLALLSTSPGGRGGSTNLDTLAARVPWWGATLVGTFSLGRFHTAFDRDAGALTDLGDTARLQALMDDLVAAACEGKGPCPEPGEMRG